MTTKHSSGIWASSVPVLYENHYGKAVPKDWRVLLKNNPDDFEFDELFGIELLKAVPKTAANAPISTTTQAPNEVVSISQKIRCGRVGYSGTLAIFFIKMDHFFVSNATV